MSSLWLLSILLSESANPPPDGSSILDEQLDLTIDVVTDAGVDTIWYTADDVVVMVSM